MNIVYYFFEKGKINVNSLPKMIYTILNFR